MSPLNTTATAQNQHDSAAQRSYATLRKYLNEVYYGDIQALRRLDADDVLKTLFRDYYVFLCVPPQGWYASFRMEATTIMRMMGLDEDETEYRLHLSSFVQYGRKLLSSYPDRPSATPTA